MIANIPLEWRSVVCQCPKAFYGDTVTGLPKRIFQNDGTRLFICVSCSKPSSHCIYKCVNCSDIFLKDYSHPAWILDWPKCWSCCERDEDRATVILVGHLKQPRVQPTLRHLYIHITEGFVIPSFLDA